MRKTTLAFLLASIVPAHAAQLQSAYPGVCAPIPTTFANVWHVDAVNGSTPDAAHGGVAVNGVMGTADGSAAHPFNSLAGILIGYPARAPGYGHPMLSTAGYDHYPKTGVHGARDDDDWNPAAPDPTRVNPGDQVVVHGGTAGNNYGDVTVGWPGVPGNGVNVDVNGNTAFVDFVAAPSPEVHPIVNTVSLSSIRGWIFDGIDGVSTVHQGAAGTAIVKISSGATAATGTQDVVIQNGFYGDGYTNPGWNNNAYVSFTGSIAGTVLTPTAGATPVAGRLLTGTGVVAGTIIGGSPGAWTVSVPQTVASETLYASDTNSWTYNERGAGITLTGSSTAVPATLSCATIQSNKVEWIGGGVSASGTINTTVQNNHVQYFSGDSFDNFSNSNTSWLNNYASDSFEDGSGIHPDFLQLAFYGVHGPFENVTIRNNYFATWTDPAMPYFRGAQGIDNTNEVYDHTIVTGNVVVTSACLALNFGAATNSLFDHNTVVNDGVKSSCSPWFQIGDTASAGNTVTNNVVAGAFHRGGCADGATWAGNYSVKFMAGGVVTAAANSGCVGSTYYPYGNGGNLDGVTVDSTSNPSTLFTAYNPPATALNPVGSMDLHPSAASELLKSTTVSATPTDMNGVPFTSSASGAFGP